jgi:tetratricopeptide (TPR) repeat protein/transglutaminase-like putative cysteine protease
MATLGLALPTEGTALQIAFWSGRVVILLLTVGGILMCLAIIRRPTTNTKCVLALILVLVAFLVSGVLSVAATFLTSDAAAEVLGLVRTLGSIALLLAAIVVGILGLLECQDRRSVFKQGSAQAAWALIISAVLVTASLSLGDFSSLLSSFASAQVGAPGEPLVFEDRNFRFRSPGVPWKTSDTNSTGRRALLAFERTTPEMSLTVMADKYGQGFTTEQLAESGKGLLRKGFSAEKVLERKPLSLGGLDGIQLETRATSGRKELLTVQWYCFTNGFGYQLVSTGPWRNRRQVAREASQLFSLFECIDLSRATDASGTGFETNFISPHYSYSVIVTNSEWRQWNALQRQFSWFDFAARHEAGFYMAVVPVWLGEPIDEEALRGAMLTTMNIAYPDEDLMDRKPLVLGDLAGVQFDYERYVYEVPYHYRLRILQGTGFAYLVCAWAERHKTNYNQVLDEALSRVKFESAATSAPGLDKLSKPERATRALVLNQVGAFYYKIEDFVRAKRLFAAAHSADPEPLYFENTLMAWMHLGQPAEALAFAETHAGVLSGSAKLRALTAHFQGQTGKVEEALASYSRLFADGFKDMDVFADYVRLLNSRKRHEEALAAIRRELKTEDLLALRLLEASVYSEKGDYAEAIRLLKVQRERAPFVPEVGHTLAMAYLDAGEFENARSVCGDLLKTGEPDWETHVLKGRSEMGLEQFEEAKTSFERALRLKPGDLDLRKTVETVTAMLGQGENTIVKNPIAPVEIPSLLMGAAANPAPAGYGKEYGAFFARRITALQFAKETGWKKTDYGRVHILDSSGVNAFSTIGIPFDPLSEEIFINSIRVHQSSGSVVTGKVARCYVTDDVSSGLASYNKNLNIPVSGLRPGCTLEFMVTRRDLAQVTEAHEIPFLSFAFSRGVPVRQSIIYVAGEPAGLKSVTSPPLEARNIQGGRYWVCEDPIILRPEPLHPPADEFVPMLWLGDNSGRWPALAAKYLASISDRMVLDQELRAQAKVLTAGLDREAQKVVALARHVQTNYTYQGLEFGSRGRMPEMPAEMAQNKYGDCKDHSVMLQQMLQASGVNAWLALVNSSAAVRKELPSLDQFDHMVVYVPSCGAGAFIDCTQKGVWPGQGPPDGLGGREALILDKTSPRFEPIPQSPEVASVVESTRTVRVAAAGDVHIEEILRVSGMDAGGMRDNLMELAAANRRIYLQKHLKHGEAELESWDIADLDDPSVPLRIKMVYKLRDQFHLVDGRLLGSVPSLLERFYLQLDQVENRVSPFQLKYPLTFKSKVSITGPDGFQFQRPPGPHHNLDEPFLSAQCREELKGPELRLDFECVQKRGTFPASKYASFRDASSRALALIGKRIALEPPGK